MEYTEDHIALAAEYALGTLDADERSQVETMMSADKDFTNMVRAWEYRLGVLTRWWARSSPGQRSGTGLRALRDCPNRRRRSCFRSRRRLCRSRRAKPRRRPSTMRTSSGWRIAPPSAGVA